MIMIMMMMMMMMIKIVIVSLLLLSATSSHWDMLLVLKYHIKDSLFNKMISMKCLTIHVVFGSSTT